MSTATATKTAAGVMVALLGTSRPLVARVVESLERTGGFRSHDLERPVREVLEVLDPMVSSERSLRGLVAEFGWDGAVTHRVHGPEVRRLLACMRTELPGRYLPASLWVSSAQASIRASESMLGAGPVLVHGVTTDAEVAWLRSAGASLWHVRAHADEQADRRADYVVEAGAGVSSTALGRRIERELARLSRELSPSAPREDA